ncbi:MAG: ABC transporter permease [Gammaproteobacteria bacterium]
MRNFWIRLRRDPTFAAIFVVTLALGVGANAALFSGLRGYFLAPLPYTHGNRLIVIQQSIGGSNGISVAAYDYLRRNARSLAVGGLVHDEDGILVIGNGMAHTVRLEAVTPSWFKTLGVAPLLGRTFGAEAVKPGSPLEVVLSYRFWRNAMHDDLDVVGKTIHLNGRLYRVIGVMPRSFHFSSRQVKFWVPFHIAPTELRPDQTFDLRGILFVARLRPVISRSAAVSDLNALAQRQVEKTSAATQNQAKKQHYHIVTKSLRTSFMGNTGARLLLIELGAALLLLLTAGILANLVTVRTLARRHNVALRMALGASRFDLWRAALAETLPLGFIAGALAVGLAWWGTTLIARFGIGTAGTAFHIAPDVWVVLFSLLLGCVVGAVAALPSVFTSRKHLLMKLSEGGGSGVSRRTRLVQSGLSVMQIALGVALMINAAQLSLAFKHASSHPIGVTPQHLVIADLGLHGSKFSNQKSQLDFYREFGNAMRALPGVKSAGVASELPFVGGFDGYGVDALNGVASRNAKSVIEFVDGHVLSALQPKLLHGRLIYASDVRAKAPVAVIDAGLAQFLFGTTDVIGREIKANRKYRIIGVIGSLQWRAHPIGNLSGTMWLPYSIAPADPAFYAGPDMDLAVRSTLPPRTVKREIDALLHKLAPEQAFSVVRSMQNVKQVAYHSDEALPVLFGVFSLLALVLAGVGTYGTMAYLIRRRLREFAVRQALGATPGRICFLALLRGAMLAVIGIGIGVVAGYLLSRGLSGMIAGTEATSALASIVSTIVMAIAVIGATAIPTLRARRADLVSLLRPQ